MVEIELRGRPNSEDRFLKRIWLVHLCDVMPAKRDAEGHLIHDGDGECIYDQPTRVQRCFVTGRKVRVASNTSVIQISDGVILFDPEDPLVLIDDRCANPRDKYEQPLDDFRICVITGPDGVNHVERTKVPLIIEAPFFRR